MSDERPSHPSLPNSAFATACPTCGATVGVNTAVCGQCGATLTGPTGTVVVGAPGEDAARTVVTTGGTGNGAAATSVGGTSGENADRLRDRVQDAVGTDFRLVELLGRGGMGIVFRANETALDREVALKVLPLDPILAPEAYERFEREAKLAARLDHPNIVPIFSVGRRESVAFYTMRLVRGGSVEQMLESRSRFEYDHALAILRDVAAALDYAHGRGVVHRDIKPANILIGETGHALVADFGIAKALGSTSAAAGATGTGIIGSPGYMSPEQWKGDVVNGRADQYALAVVAFEMLAGRRPYESPNMQELLQKHLAGEVPSVSTYRFGLHEGVDAAMKRALAKSAEERFPTATAFVDALAGLRSATTMRSMRVPKYEPAARPKRTWLRRVALLSLILGATAGAAFAAPQTRPQAVRFASLARERAESIVEQVRYAIVPPTLDVTTDSLVSDGDSLALALAEPGDSSFIDPSIGALGGDSVARALEIAAGTMETGRQPIAVDPQLYGEEPSPFRPARPVGEFGWVRVVLHGGVAPIIVDGVTVSGMARPAGHLVRVETGRHYVAVRGAGTLYVPSQIAIEVSATDTVEAVFAVPHAIITPAAPAAPVEDSSGAAQPRMPADSAGSDSTPPPVSPPAASAAPAARPDSAGTDTTRIVPPPRR